MFRGPIFKKIFKFGLRLPFSLSYDIHLKCRKIKDYLTFVLSVSSDYLKMFS